MIQGSPHCAGGVHRAGTCSGGAPRHRRRAECTDPERWPPWS